MLSATLAGTQLGRGHEEGCAGTTDCARQCVCEELSDFALMTVLEKLPPRVQINCAARVNRWVQLAGRLDPVECFALRARRTAPLRCLPGSLLLPWVALSLSKTMAPTVPLMV